MQINPEPKREMSHGQLGEFVEDLAASFSYTPYPGFSMSLKSGQAEDFPIRIPAGEGDKALQGIGTAQAEQVFVLDVTIDGVSVGKLEVVNPSASPMFRPYVENLVLNSIEKIEMRLREDALLEELANSWESLNAVYEVSAAAYSSTDINKLLIEILQRVSSVAEGLKVVLWQEADSELRPLIAVGCDTPGRHKAAGSFVAEALRSRSTVVLNSLGDGERQRGHEELRNATGLILLPLSMRGGRPGIMQVWREGPAPFFDTKIVRFLEALATQASIVIENDRLRVEWQENVRLNQEIDIGSRIQQSLLVGEAPQSMQGIKVASVTMPSRRIDGDFIDFMVNSPDCLDVVVGDVMGKGVPAALLAAAVKEQLQKSLVKLGQETAYGMLPEPEDVINAVNRPLTKHMIELDSFATLCFARFDRRKEVLTLVDCGHPKSIHFRRSVGECSFIKGRNLPLGFDADEEYSQVTVDFGPGDVFVFYSDGVTEAMNSKMDLFGEERLASTLKESSRLEPEEIVQKIQRAVMAFSEEEQLADDFTLVVVRIDDFRDTLVRARMEVGLVSELAELAKARELVRRICSVEPVVDEMVSGQLELGVTEALSNVIRHGHSDLERQPITLKAERFGAAVVFRIYHWGKPFSPPTEAPTYDLSREGGFGLFLMTELFDETTYMQDEFGRNCVRLMKNL